VSWETLLGVVERLSEAIGREALVASGADFVQTVPDFAALARRFLQPFSLVRFAFEVVDPAVYPMLTIKADMLGPLRFNVRSTLAPELRPSDLFWEYWTANLEAMPKYC